MSSEADWLVSPSKARIARAQAQDWQFVDAFLAKKYSGKRPPTFERNEDTLEALLALATSSDHADDQRNAVEKLEKFALQTLTKRSDGEDVFQVITHHLSPGGLTGLDVLAGTIIALDLPVRSSPVDLALAATSLQHQQFEASQMARSVARQVDMQQRETTRLQAILRDSGDDAFRPADDLPEKTVEWTKNAKHLKAKIGEYEERYSGLRPHASATSIEDVAKHNSALLHQRGLYQAAHAELDVFQDLPTGLNEARKVVENARDELRMLTRKRDELFEDLVKPA